MTKWNINSVLLLLCFGFTVSNSAFCQNASIKGRITSGKKPLEYVNIILSPTLTGTVADTSGNYILKNIPPGSYTIRISCIGYQDIEKKIILRAEETAILNFSLIPEGTILDEIVVTGVSRATRIKENPVAIISVSSKTLEQTNETNIIDALVKNVPGLNAIKTGPNISKPFIRGLGYNRVLTLYDGMRQEGQQWGDEHGIEVDEYSIEKSEVIKGPSSLMYGSDALAGVVSLFPAMPDRSDRKIYGKYFSEYQNNNGLIGNGLRLMYADDHWGYALRGSYRIAKNYLNRVDRRVYNTGFQEANVSASIKHTGNKGYSDFNFTLYDNLQGIPDGSRDSLTRKFTKQIYEGSFDDIKNRPIVPDAGLNSYQLSPLHQHIQHYRIYSKSHYQLGKGDCDLLFAFQQNIRREYDHPTLPDQAGMFVRLNTFNYGLRYDVPEILNTEITVGVNGMSQSNKNKNATDFPIPDYNLFDAGSFVYAKWKQNKWGLSGGIRYDIRYLKGNNFYTITDLATEFTRRVTLPDTTGAYLQFPAFTKTFQGISLSIGTTYQVSDKISLKANIARGYRSPSITEFASDGLDPGAHIVYLGNRDFVPEFSLQEDIGADIYYKNISASLSMFNNNIQHYIYLSLLTDVNGSPIINTQGNKTYQYQQSSAWLYGMEATFELHPSIIKGFSFDNAFSIIYGYNKKADYKGKGVDGEYLPFIPPIKLLSSITEEIKTKSKTFPSITAKAEADINARQDRYLALNNTETATPGYTLFNFSINTQINYSKNNTLQFQLQVNNAFDKIYQSNLSRLKYFEYYLNSPNGRLGIYNMGRNICMKAIVQF